MGDPGHRRRPPGRAAPIGISSLGYTVPSLSRAREQAARHGRPWAGLPGNGRCARSRVAAARTTDLDGVLIELVERPAEAPVFSHLRINVTDLDASVAWYEHLGFRLGRPSASRKRSAPCSPTRRWSPTVTPRSRSN